ncbi:MAG: class I SAM-dependent methyltransferase [Thermoanaerobaculia bacterium]
MYWNDLDHHLGEERLGNFWMDHPRVRAYINESISGSAGRWPTDWFRDTFAERLPLDEALVLGCGTGGLERDLVGKGVACRALGIDVVEEPLAFARDAARSAGLSGRIRYRRADARAFLEDLEEPAEAIFFQASLHHFDDVPDFLELVRSRLRPQGLLYLDEYVGPSMSSWRWWRLAPLNAAYYLLPRKLRRGRLVRAPVNPDDPTESVDSGRILGAVTRNFRVLERRDYGGNLLAYLFPNLAKPGDGRRDPTPAEFDRAVDRLIALEKKLLASRWLPESASYHTVLVAEAS